MQVFYLKLDNLFSCDTFQTHLRSCFMVDITESTKNGQIKKALPTKEGRVIRIYSDLTDVGAP